MYAFLAALAAFGIFCTVVAAFERHNRIQQFRQRHALPPLSLN